MIISELQNYQMTETEILDKLYEFAQKELLNNILPYWSLKTIDTYNEGFIGKIDEKNHSDFNADKGLILNARILWTFSAVSGKINDLLYKNLASRAFDYILRFFYDKEYNGFYWKLNYKGIPIETKKQIYAQAFVIYALSEYYLLTDSQESLNKAIETFALIEKYSYDNIFNGYLEAFDREWRLIDDLRLSTKDMNEKKTMNTHLHILEAYTNLFRIYKNDELKNKIIGLLDIFYDHILDKSDYHYNLFFDEEWNLKSNLISFGHDIEGSWLMLEAAETIGDQNLIEKFKSVAVKMADACLEGIYLSGALSQDVERGKNILSRETEWWVQAEAVVGFFFAYKVSGRIDFLETAYKVAQFIQDYIVDREYGEWVNLVSSNGEAIPGNDKVGFWKCPYHNARMCIELMKGVNY